MITIIAGGIIIAPIRQKKKKEVLIYRNSMRAKCPSCLMTGSYCSSFV